MLTSRCFALVLLLPAFTLAQAPDLITQVRDRVTQEMKAHDIVGLSVAISESDHIILSESFGFEDREKNIAASKDTMYRWASVSKPMTAVVIMQLANERKLDLDADVRVLVPEFPEKPWPVTCRQLLCHQGGIVHYDNGKVIKTVRKYTDPHPFADTIVALDYFKESPLIAEPGTKYSYTTHGFMLLGAAAQRAGKEPFATEVKKRIAGPCGMRTLRPDYQWESIPHRAVGYRKSKPGAMEKSTDTDVSWKLPGGGWISTCDDMARFGLGMLSDKLVDAPTKAQMWTAQKTRDGAATTYGLGFGVGKLDTMREISHSGAQEKTATVLLILPDAPHPVSIAIMCNTEGSNLHKLAEDLARIVIAPHKDK